MTDGDSSQDTLSSSTLSLIRLLLIHGSAVYAMMQLAHPHIK